MVERGHKLVAKIFHCIVALVDFHIVMALLVHIGIAQLQGCKPGVATHHPGEIQIDIGLYAQVVHVEIGTMEHVISMVHHPVNHPMATMIETTQRSRHAFRMILHSGLYATVFLGFESRISVVGGALVIKVGKGGQTEALVVGHKHLPALGRPVGDVHARIEVMARVYTRVHVGQHSCTHRPMIEYQIVLDIIAEVAAVVTTRIANTVFASHIHILALFEVLAQACAEHILLTEVCTDGSASAPPVELRAHLHAEHIKPVEVFAKGFAMHQFKVVIHAVPVDSGGELHTSLRLGTHAGRISFIAFILVRIGCTVEGIGTIGFLAHTHLPIQVGSFMCPSALIIKMPLAPLAVVGTSIATATASTYAVVHSSQGQDDTAISLEGAKTSALGSCAHLTFCVLAGDDIDGTPKGIAAIHTSGCALEHLYALYVLDGHRKVHGQMTSNGIVEKYAIEEQSDLVESASVNGNVRLNTKATALSDINAVD